jgi:hypothetical protein
MAPGGRPSRSSYTLQVGNGVCPVDPLRWLRRWSRRASSRPSQFSAEPAACACPAESSKATAVCKHPVTASRYYSQQFLYRPADIIARRLLRAGQNAVGHSRTGGCPWCQPLRGEDLWFGYGPEAFQTRCGRPPNPAGRVVLSESSLPVPTAPGPGGPRSYRDPRGSLGCQIGVSFLRMQARFLGHNPALPSERPDVLRVTVHFELRALPINLRATASVRPPGGSSEPSLQ